MARYKKTNSRNNPKILTNTQQTNKQLACLSGSNGQQKAQGGYVRHILAGSPKRSHFSSSRRQIGNGHVSEVSSSGVNGTAKKRVSSI